MFNSSLHLCLLGTPLHLLPVMPLVMSPCSNVCRHCQISGEIGKKKYVLVEFKGIRDVGESESLGSMKNHIRAIVVPPGSDTG